jgi:hypothetical protein
MYCLLLFEFKFKIKKKSFSSVNATLVQEKVDKPNQYHHVQPSSEEFVEEESENLKIIEEKKQVKIEHFKIY